MNNPVSPSQAERAFVLAEGLWAIYRKLKRKLREQGEQSHLRPAQVSVVLCLHKDGPATVSSLARAEGMRPQSMSAIITSLLDPAQGPWPLRIPLSSRSLLDTRTSSGWAVTKRLFQFAQLS
jgi:hypothetical protein